MASWKKVIVSGSAADLLNVTASAGISAATIKDVTSFTAAGDIDIGAHGFRVESLTADGLTSGRVVFAGSSGILSDDSDFTFATDTLTVTKIGAFEAAGAIDFSDENMTNVDIDSGTIDGTDVTVGSGKTLDVSAGTLTLANDQISGDAITGGTIGSITISQLGGALDVNNENITNVDINSGTIDGTTIGVSSHNTIKGTTIDATTDFTIDGLVITADDITNDAALEIQTAAGDITLDPGGNNVLPGSDSADSLGASGTAWAKLWVDDIDLNAQGSISIGGTGRIDLDADDDTSIRASADDVIAFEAGGVEIAQITATSISGSSISTGSFSDLKAIGAGAAVAASSASLVSFRNNANSQYGYLATADTQAVTTGLVGYNTSTGNLTISSVIDGGSF